MLLPYLGISQIYVNVRGLKAMPAFMQCAETCRVPFYIYKKEKISVMYTFGQKRLYASSRLDVTRANKMAELGCSLQILVRSKKRSGWLQVSSMQS